MRRVITLSILCVGLIALFDAATFAQNSGGNKPELVDLKADIAYPHKINDTTSVLCLVGNFAAQHNGAVITADSAVRFENDMLKCFGNVLINKNTTYAYSDSVTYDNKNNIATLFSPIVKVVDEDITLFAREFSFNTKTNIGEYWNGGFTSRKTQKGVDGKMVDTEDLMESRRGYYFSDDKRVTGVRFVELSGDGYKMRGDSIIYIHSKEEALFFKNTNMWSRDNDYIFGDLGRYIKNDDHYIINDNGYVLTKEQEAWSDSLEYYRGNKHARLRNNIQIIDFKNSSIALGDYGEYWGVEEKILLTKNPAVMNFDKEEGLADTIMLRADTILITSYLLGTGPFAEETKQAEKEAQAEGLQTEVVSSGETSEQAPKNENAEEGNHSHDHEKAEEVKNGDKDEDKEPSRRELRLAKREQRALEKLTAERAKRHRDLMERKAKLEQRIEERRAKGKNIYSDSMVLIRINNELNPDTLKSKVTSDSKGEEQKTDTPQVAAADSTEKDSLYRVITAFRNVKSYKKDFQMVCDSLVGFSYDSIIRLYYAPVLWSETQQISSEEMELFTKNGMMDYADFEGDPISASMVAPKDTTHYNQVSGKTMRTLFENNDVVQNDVNGNVRTIYFITDEDTGDVTTISTVESGSATFYIENNELDGVLYRAEPTYVFAPLDKLPADMSLYLPGFKWYGERRPTRNAVITRTIRPSIKEEKSKITQPTFPIKKAIEDEQKSLEATGVWRNRNEKVSTSATKWMRSLGFEPGQKRPEGSEIF